MSETVTEDQAAELAGLTAVAAALGVALAEVWPELDLGDISGSVAGWVEVTVAIVEEHAEAAAALAVEYFEQLREDADVRSDWTPELALPETEVIERHLRWAIRDAVADPDAALERVEKVSERLVTNTARDTIADTVEHDDDALGFARVAQPDACAFCLLLATRDKLYESSHTAIREDIDGYHTNCNCKAVPVFRGQAYQAPDWIDEWETLYESAAKGYSGKDRMRAFGRAVYAERGF